MSELLRTLSEILNRKSDSVSAGSQEPQAMNPAAVGSQQSVSAVEPGAVILTDDDHSEMQREKIAAIRRAIESGAYDSEELLQVAVERMMRRLCDTEGTP